MMVTWDLFCTWGRTQAETFEVFDLPLELYPPILFLFLFCGCAYLAVLRTNNCGQDLVLILLGGPYRVPKYRT